MVSDTTCRYIGRRFGLPCTRRRRRGLFLDGVASTVLLPMQRLAERCLNFGIAIKRDVLAGFVVLNEFCSLTPVRLATSLKRESLMLSVIVICICMP